ARAGRLPPRGLRDGRRRLSLDRARGLAYRRGVGEARRRARAGDGERARAVGRGRGRAPLPRPRVARLDRRRAALLGTGRTRAPEAEARRLRLALKRREPARKVGVRSDRERAREAASHELGVHELVPAAREVDVSEQAAVAIASLASEPKSYMPPR